MFKLLSRWLHSQVLSARLICMLNGIHIFISITRLGINEVDQYQNCDLDM